jgi:integrase
VDPTDAIPFLPQEKTKKYVPSVEDINRVIRAADSDTRDYLVTIRDTFARVGEVNALTWDDIDFRNREVVLHTRKKKGGNRTPRSVPMTEELFQVLSRRFRDRDPEKPWVFWRVSRRGNKAPGPFKYRKSLLGSLCKKAGVKSFSFHALRHSGASILDHENVPLATIQKILGHENRSTTEGYVRSIGQSEREAMRAFERRIAEKSHTDSHTADEVDEEEAA